MCEGVDDFTAQTHIILAADLACICFNFNIITLNKKVESICLSVALKKNLLY